MERIVERFRLSGFRPEGYGSRNSWLERVGFNAFPKSSVPLSPI